MSRLLSYINEEFDIIERDIDVLYEPLDTYVKRFNKIQNDIEFNNMWVNVSRLKHKSLTNNYIVKSFKSSVLKSELCKLANSICPVSIDVGFVNPTYNMFEKTILCGIRPICFTGSFKHEKINKNRIKSVIRHELTHWIDDTLNNLYISNIYKTQDWDVITKSGEGEMESTDHEIKAQVEQVREMLRRLPSKFRKNITFDIIVKIMKWEHKRKKLGWVKKISSYLRKEGIVV
jgi:hypothetical protein